MQSTTTTVTASDGTALHTHRWLPDGPPRAVVQIAHGHGRALRAATPAWPRRSRQPASRSTPTTTAATAARRATADHGYFADHDGWDTVVADLRAVTDFAREEHPGLPVFLLGHSMGSFLTRALRHRGQPRAVRHRAVRHRRRPGPARQGRAAVAHDRGTAARAAAREHAARQADLRPVQRGLQAQPHRLRLALARRGRGRPVRRRPAVRQHLHLGLLRRPGSAAWADQRPPPGGPGAPRPADPAHLR